MNLLNVGGTMTGGSTVVLQPGGYSPGRAVFTFPTNGRLTPQWVQFTAAQQTTTKAANAGVATSGMKVSIADRQTEEGCCTVTAGAVEINLGFRWDLSQPETLVDSAVDYLRSLVNASYFKDLLVKGTLPA